MDLILWRHADAEDGAPDLARRLTPKGLAQAARVAAWLRPHLPQGYRMRVSPAARAQQTARALSESFETLQALAPGATVEAILKAAGGGTTILVGHQPDLGAAIAYLLCGEERDWSVEKGAIWWIENRSAIKAVISPDLLP